MTNKKEAKEFTQAMLIWVLVAIVGLVSWSTAFVIAFLTFELINFTFPLTGAVVCATLITAGLLFGLSGFSLRKQKVQAKNN